MIKLSPLGLASYIGLLFICLPASALAQATRQVSGPSFSQQAVKAPSTQVPSKDILFTSELLASQVDPQLLKYFDSLDLKTSFIGFADATPLRFTEPTQELRFASFAAFSFASTAWAQVEFWNQNHLQSIFPESSVAVQQILAQGVEGKTKTPTHIRLVGPDFLECDFSLRVDNNPESLLQLHNITELKEILSARGLPSAVILMQTRNCNLAFKWTYQLSLVYPIAENKTRVFTYGRLYIKQETLDKLKFISLFTSAKAIFDKRLAGELRSFANSLQKLIENSPL